MTERARDRRIMGALAVTLVAYYLLTLGGHQYSRDGIIMFQSAKQLLFHHSFALVPPVLWERPAHVSIFGIGLTLAYIPLLVLWSPLLRRMGLTSIPYDPLLAHNPALYANLPYLLCSVLNPIVTAATGCVVFRMARLLRLSPAWSLLAAAAYGLASPAAAYARYDFSQPLAGLALTAAAWQLLESRGSAARWPWMAGGASLGYAILTRPEMLAAVPCAVGWAWLDGRGRPAGQRAARMAALLTPVAVAVAAWLWINRLKFGAVGHLGYAPPPVLFSARPTRVLVGVVGLLVSPTAGILEFFPLSVLAVPGLRWLARHDRPTAAFFAGLLAVFLVLYGSFIYWWGAWCWGPRFLVPFLPIVTLAAATWASGGGTPSPARRASFALLALAGLVVSLNGILFDFVEHRRWLAHAGRLPETADAQFMLAASPLVSGWLDPAPRSLDLFWTRLLDPVQVQAYGRLLGPLGGAGRHLSVLAAAAGAAILLLLVAVVAAGAYRLVTLARPARSGPAGTAEESFWSDVSTAFPSLKGAASTAYYFECERGLLAQFLPHLAGSSLLKTDLWDEAKNTEILRWAAERGARPFGVDIALDTVRLARGVLAGREGGCIAGDVRALPFTSGAFDAIYSMGTIEHSPAYGTAAQEIARVLRPGGVAIVGVPNKLDPFLRPLLVHVMNGLGLYGYGFEKSFTPRQLRRLLEGVGLQVTAQTGILFMPGWLRMADLWCHARRSRLTVLTGVLVRPFAWLHRRVPAVRRHGYLTVCVATKVVEPRPGPR